MTLVRIQNAVVRRAEHDILRVDSFALEEGESVALLGPNGAGKSTFVGLITREVMPLHRDEPPVLFRGRPNMTLEDIKRQIGFVSAVMQKQVSVGLTAAQVVEGGLFGSLGVPKRFHVTPEQHERALGVLEELGMAQLAGRQMNTLSSGQARRVLIARSLVHDPSVLVFDEPCAGLDPEGMFWVRKTMRAVAQSGRAVVLVTHSLEDIVPEIDRVLLVQNAHVLADGRKADVLTDRNLSRLFGVPLEVRRDGAYYALDMRY